MHMTSLIQFLDWRHERRVKFGTRPFCASHFWGDGIERGETKGINDVTWCNRTCLCKLVGRISQDVKDIIFPVFLLCIFSTSSSTCALEASKTMLMLLGCLKSHSDGIPARKVFLLALPCICVPKKNRKEQWVHFFASAHRKKILSTLLPTNPCDNHIAWPKCPCRPSASLLLLCSMWARKDLKPGTCDSHEIIHNHHLFRHLMPLHFLLHK